MLDSVVIEKTIKKYGEKRGLSQEVLSGLARNGRTHLSAIERGERRPTLDTFYKLGEAMNVRPSELLAAIENELKNKKMRIGFCHHMTVHVN